MGLLTSDGYESIFMAMFSYKKKGSDLKGITKPNILLPINANIDFNKACFYLDIEARVIDLDKKYQVDISQVKKKIDKNTICIIGNCSSFPHG